MLIYTKESFPGTAINTEHLMKPDKIIQQFAVDDLTIALEYPRKWKIKRTVQRRMPVCFFEGKKKRKKEIQLNDDNKHPSIIPALPDLSRFMSVWDEDNINSTYPQRDTTTQSLHTLPSTTPHNTKCGS